MRQPHAVTDDLHREPEPLIRRRNGLHQSSPPHPEQPVDPFQPPHGPTKLTMPLAELDRRFTIRPYLLIAHHAPAEAGSITPTASTAPPSPALT
jgi:hypothetical protein